MTMTIRPLFLLLIVCSVSICLLSAMPAANAAASSIVWAQTQAYYEEHHAVPDDDVWIDYQILRSGDTSGPARVTFSVAEATIGNGNNPGEYELLGTNPIVFGSGSTYALIKVRFHNANHDVFGTQRITLRLSDSDADIESDQEARTIYVDYPAVPVMAFASPPAGGYRCVEGQGYAVIINITKDGDILVDSYADVFASGTATNELDYSLADASGRPVGIPGTIHLPPGESVYSIYLTPLKDSNDEGNETATLTLGNLKNVAAGNLTSVSVSILEAGTVTPLPPAITPVSTPTPVPSATPTSAPGTPSGTTPVPLPSPGFEIGAGIMAVAAVVVYLGWRKNE